MLGKEREAEIRRELQPEHTDVIDCLDEIDRLRSLCGRAAIKLMEEGASNREKELMGELLDAAKGGAE